MRFDPILEVNVIFKKKISLPKPVKGWNLNPKSVWKVLQMLPVCFYVCEGKVFLFGVKDFSVVIWRNINIIYFKVQKYIEINIK